MVVEEDEEDEEDDEDELEDDEEEEELEVVLEDVDDVVDVLEDVDEEEMLVEVVEELGVVVDSVEDGVWLDETVCDWVLLLFDEPEVRTKYPPTAATITTTTIMPITAVLNAVRLLRANDGKRSDVCSLRAIFLKRPAIWAFIALLPADSPMRDLEKFDSVPAVLEGGRFGSNPIRILLSDLPKGARILFGVGAIN